MTKYRILKRATGDNSSPFRYLAQKRGLFGIWEFVAHLSWSYDVDAAEEYIRQHIKSHPPKQKLPADEVVKEIEG